MSEATTPTPNIYGAILEIQKDLPVVPKRREADTGKYKYSFADIADLSAAVLPRLSALDVVYICEPQWEGGIQFLLGSLVHVPTETRISGRYEMKGVRTPQESGSATTYYRRYILGCLTGVLTDNDEDGTIASKVQAEAIRAEIAQATTPDEIASIAKDRGLRQGTILHQEAMKRWEDLSAAASELGA